MIIVALTLFGTAAACGDTPRQEIQGTIANSKHMMIDTCRPPSVYIERGDLASKQIDLTNLIHSEGRN
jgi:hypothetical protein